MNKKVVTLGEILLRLSPPDNKRIINSNLFDVNYGGAESNVAVNLSLLGIETTIVTKLPDNELGKAAVRHLNGYGVNTENILFDGDRMGAYFLENGVSSRNSKVIYDRKNSAFSQSKISDFDFDSIFKDAKLFHVSGITLGLSKEMSELARVFMKEAKTRNITVSFDFNYRSKLWTLEEASESIKQVLEYVDIAFAGYLDFTNILGIHPQKTYNQNNIFDCYQELYPKVSEKYGFKYIVSSIRNSISASENNYTGIFYNGKEIISSKEYNVKIVDRVGSGDAFTSGFIYSYLKNKEDRYKAEFATASAVLKHSIFGDVNLVTKDEIESLFDKKGFDVVR